MRKKRRVSRMSPTSIIDFVSRKKAKHETKYTQVKPIKKLTREQMKSSMDFKRESQESQNIKEIKNS
jgi:hypothetical protein